ncbi:MAG: ABC transporter substrate-binding protein [Desulfobacterium sp.]|jgi:NitT/TauT family transport system substrate-binding protein|nr:ABC transporter substrate-binding protein [Desulfobacterium sp.]
MNKNNTFITFFMALAAVLFFFPYDATCATLNYRLKWLFNTSSVGDLYALDQGFFKGAGLDIIVKAGGPERDAIRELELGHAAFGVASADQVIRAREKGAPVVVIAQLFQINPLQWVYRAVKPAVNSPRDLKGRVLGVTYGGNDETIMGALLARADLKKKDVSLYSVRYDYTPFYRDMVDLWPCYINAQGIILADKLAREGEAVKFFNPADHGITFVANSVITSQDALNSHPKTVQAFVRALMAGWTEALLPENREKALAVLRKYNRDTPEDLRKKQLDATRILVVPPAPKRVGAIDVGGWKQTEQIMLDQGVINSPVRVEEALFPGGNPL